MVAKKETLTQHLRFLPLALFILLSLLVFVLIGLSHREIKVERLGVIEDRIHSMEQLVSARQTYREVVYSEKKILLSDKRVLFSLIFTVEAGFPLQKCRLEKGFGNRVTLYLPPVQILSIDSDETSIKQYFVKEQWATVRFSDYVSIIEEEKERILWEARQSGILIRAESNGINTLRGIFEMADLDVTIRYSESLGLGHLLGPSMGGQSDS